MALRLKRGLGDSVAAVPVCPVGKVEASSGWVGSTPPVVTCQTTPLSIFGLPATLLASAVPGLKATLLGTDADVIQGVPGFVLSAAVWGLLGWKLLGRSR